MSQTAVPYCNRHTLFHKRLFPTATDTNYVTSGCCLLQQTHTVSQTAVAYFNRHTLCHKRMFPTATDTHYVTNGCCLLQAKEEEKPATRTDVDRVYSLLKTDIYDVTNGYWLLQTEKKRRRRKVARTYVIYICHKRLLSMSRTAFACRK